MRKLQLAALVARGLFAALAACQPAQAQFVRFGFAPYPYPYAYPFYRPYPFYPPYYRPPVFYAPPPRYYAPPPGYYAPPPVLYPGASAPPRPAIRHHVSARKPVRRSAPVNPLLGPVNEPTLRPAPSAPAAPQPERTN